MDAVLFFVAFFCAEFLVLHGKAVSSYLFADYPSLLRSSANTLVLYGIILASSVALTCLRISRIERRLKLLFSSIVGFAAALAVQLHDSPSPLIFFLQLFTYGTATGIIWMESFLKVNSKEMDREFWVILFENVFKSIRYILIAYGALIVVLKFITSEMSGTYMDFLTTLVYPTVLVLFSIFAIGYWVLVPCWHHIVESHRSVNDSLEKMRTRLHLKY